MSDKLLDLTLKLISENRHGFLTGKSILTNLILFSNSVPSLHHQILILKLRKLNFSTILINWIDGYLRGRKISVNIKGIKSS